MKNGFYFRFARDSIRKNKRLFYPFIFTLAFMSAVFFMINGLSAQPFLQNAFGGRTVIIMLHFGTWVMGLFSLIFLFYTNSMVLKQRKREFGLYNVLGMGKRHIVRLLFAETVLSGLIGLLLGLIVGALFSYAAELLLLNLMGMSATAVYVFPVQSVFFTLAVFAVLLFLIFCNGARSIAMTNTVSLLNSASEGEREPKAKALLALVGAALLGGGYYLAITITDPIKAMALFFVAVVMVILGTYLLFTAGSIVLLKALRRNRRYYYRTSHFISVSGMLYRMKQNALSLASVCILSTMVLVTISTTVSLYVGANSIIDATYPRDFSASVSLYDGEYTPALDDMLARSADNVLSTRGLERTNDLVYHSVNLSVTVQDDVVSTDYATFEVPTGLFMIPLEDYNRAAGTQLVLGDGEILLYDPDDLIHGDSLTFCYGSGDNTVQAVFDIRDELPVLSAEGLNRNYASTLLVAVLPDMDELLVQRALYGVPYSTEDYTSVATLNIYLGFDVSNDLASAEDCDELSTDLSVELYHQRSALSDTDPTLNMGTSTSSRAVSRSDMISLYSGLFFLGIFLGLVFTVSAALIIYYKQLSEGLTDRRRFEIMKKVGLTEGEIKKSIRSQVLTVFFLPLVVAGIHSAFALPMLNRSLQAVTSSKGTPLAFCLGLCFVAFALFYVIFYTATSRVYYGIVDGKSRND